MDRSLATLLRSLQASRDVEDAARLLPSATGLLSRLSNPLNITLLASQLLANPLLYPRPVNLTSCRSVFSAFYTAALRFAENENNEKAEHNRSNLSLLEWTKAVIQGADDKSPRWRHLLLLGGILLGFENKGYSHLPGDLRHRIEVALVTATNLALHEKNAGDANSQLCIVFVLNTVFPLMSDESRTRIEYDLLLPQLVEATYFSPEGLEHGYWLGTIDADVRQVSKTHFHWDARSISAVRVHEIKSRVLVSALGPLARLIAHSVESVRDPNLLVAVLARLAEFSRNIALSWRQNKLSEIEVSEEGDFLEEQTRRTTFPELLQLLRNTMFSFVICLRAITGRILLDATLSSDAKAPTLAIQTLHILRDLYFISHRFGQQSSSQYMFVNYTSIDVLNQFPAQAESFLSTVRSTQTGTIPAHPLDRLNDLFFLNTAEHFTLSLRPAATEQLLVNTALPYITTNGDRRLSELYEAAHSVLLAVFAAPQNGAVSAQHIPFYVETLLHSFPTSLTPRQFRLAIRSLLQVSAPPSPIAASMQQLQEIVMDMLKSRLPQASEVLLPPADPAFTESAPLSEKSVLVLSIIENLNLLPVFLLEEWLVIAAESLQKLGDPIQKNECQKRFWEVLSSGEMDVERAAVCVTWWTSRGGRELVLFGNEMPQEVFQMSGGLAVESKL
ncbi:hypothetical protein PMZ80_000135 [Knufia obscura]|uniref:Peroxisomal membrane protein PEX17 n=2 Tax=Knufia TaxID=430999 RepID=A0AAN8ERE1_9EURO|nr:hypothetical protein PMZ80_000135 [Knufia obscura]KAK5956937.1 hypothetical protein OHC33_002426 [Knufia fluminis]